MMRKHLHAHMVVLVTIATAATISAHICPNRKLADSPRFTQKLGRRDYVRFDHNIAVLCCAEGYDAIKWYKQHDGMWVSFPPPHHGDSNTPEVQEDGQILRFYAARLNDEANYRCDVIKNSAVMLQHTMDLVVIECDPLATGPIVTIPTPQNKTIFDYGSNITFHCTGYFGCHDGNSGQLRLALWSIHGKNVTHVSPRYSVSKEDSGFFNVGASLTITSVRAIDTTRTFLCTLASDQSIHGQTVTPVRVFKQDRTNVPWLLLGLIIGGCVLFLILLTCLRCLYGPQIRLYFNSRMPTLLGPKPIDSEQYVYNLYIHHAVEDEVIAQDIKLNLAEKNYTTYITADIDGSKSVMKTFFDKTSESALVVFLYSDNLRNDELSNFYLQALITERKGKDIMFLEIAHYKPKEVMNWTLDAKDMKEPQGTDRIGRAVVNTEDMGLSITENDGPDEVEKAGMDKKDVAAEKKHKIVEDLKFWKVLPRVKVPSDRNNVRKMDNYWCSLQNKIPKFDYQKRQQKGTSKKRPNRERNSSSQKPLLDDHNEIPPLSAVPHNDDTTEEFSPNTNEVFTFEESNNKEPRVPTVLNPEENLINFNKNPSETMDDSSDDASASYACINTANGSGDVRGEVQTDDHLAQRNHKCVHLVDVDIHHGENSDLPTLGDNIRCAGNDLNQIQIREQNGTTDVLHRADESTENIFTMSGEEPKIDSFQSLGSETGYSRGNSSSKESTNNYTTSESGEDSAHRLLSNQSSSGFSDCNSSGLSSLPDSMSSTGRTNINTAVPLLTVNNNICIPYNGRSKVENGEINGTGNLKIKINPPAINRNSSSTSPESGYITSPSEHSSSTGAFLPQIKEHIERGKDVPVGEPENYKLN